MAKRRNRKAKKSGQNATAPTCAPSTRLRSALLLAALAALIGVILAALEALKEKTI